MAKRTGSKRERKRYKADPGCPCCRMGEDAKWDRYQRTRKGDPKKECLPESWD